MKRLALVLALALATPAWGLTRYVAPNGTAGLTYGFTSATPTTLPFFNSNSDKGDTCLMLAGTYNAKIEPRGTGTPDSFIVYIGNVTTPSSVVVTAINVDSSMGAARCISVKGVLATGDLSLKTDSCFYAGYDSITYCTIQGQATIQGRSNVTIRYCTIGTGDYLDKFHVTNGMKTGITYNNNGTPLDNSDDWPEHNWQRYRGIRVDSLSILDNTFRLGTTTGNNAATWRGMNRSLIDGNRWYLFGIDNRDTHLNTWYDCGYNTVTDNYFEGSISQGGTVPITYIMNLRDNNVGNVWARDTLVEAETSSKPLKAAFNTVGNNRDYGLNNPLPYVLRTYDFGDSNNTFTNCFIRVGGDIECQSKSDNNVYTFNTLVTRGFLWLSPYSVNTLPDSGASDSVIFRHNTVLSEHWRGMIVSSEHSKLNHSVFSHNILVAKNAHVPSAYIGHYGFNKRSSFTSCDSNLVWCSDPADSMWAVALDFLSGGSACKVGPNSTWGTAVAGNPTLNLGYDRMSKWGAPVFTDSSFYSFDPRPLSTGLAYSSDLWADGFVGAIAASGDGTLPTVTITSPTGSRLWATGEVMDLAWTAADNTAVTEISIQWGEGTSPTSWYNVKGDLAPTISVYDWTLPAFATGYATVRVLAYDAAGNVGTGSLTFRCDVEDGDGGPSEIDP